jgi:hypothetical protein
MRKSSLIMALILLGACSNKDTAVRVTNETQKPAAVAEPKVAMRTEPIFYNGKTYELKFGPTSGGQYAMSVLGMSEKQKKDATEVATSSLRYFKCKDSQKGQLTIGPDYVASTWKMTAKCG